MNSVKEYTTKLAKYEKELDNLSECIREISKSRIRQMWTKMCATYPSVFRKPDVIKEPDRLHEEFVFGFSWQSL